MKARLTLGRFLEINQRYIASCAEALMEIDMDDVEASTMLCLALIVKKRLEDFEVNPKQIPS